MKKNNLSTTYDKKIRYQNKKIYNLNINLQINCFKNRFNYMTNGNTNLEK